MRFIMEADYTKQAEDYLDEQTKKQAARIRRAIGALPAGLKPKTWDSVEEDEPTPDEITAFEEYRAAKRGL